MLFVSSLKSLEVVEPRLEIVASKSCDMVFISRTVSRLWTHRILGPNGSSDTALGPVCSYGFANCSFSTMGSRKRGGRGGRAVKISWFEDLILGSTDLVLP